MPPRIRGSCTQLPAEVLEERNGLESGHRRIHAFRYHRLVKRCTVIQV